MPVVVAHAQRTATVEERPAGGIDDDVTLQAPRAPRRRPKREDP